MQIKYETWLSLSAKEQHKILDSLDKAKKGSYHVSKSTRIRTARPKRSRSN